MLQKIEKLTDKCHSDSVKKQLCSALFQRKSAVFSSEAALFQRKSAKKRRCLALIFSAEEVRLQRCSKILRKGAALNQN